MAVNRCPELVRLGAYLVIVILSRNSPVFSQASESEYKAIMTMNPVMAFPVALSMSSIVLGSSL